MGTLPRLLHDRISATPDRRAYSAYVDGAWRDSTWGDYGRRARMFGLGLVALGMKRGDVVAILGQTRPEWSYCDLGAICAGGVTVGLYPTLQPTGVGSMQYVLTHSGARFLVVESGATLAAKLRPILSDLARVEHIVVWDCDEAARALDPRVKSLADVSALGEALDAKHPNAWRDACDAARPDDLALLIYTSGTTGQPKGAMISHRNAWAQAEGLAAVTPPPGQDDCTVAFLPLAHVAERCTAQHMRIRQGIAAHYARSLETLMDDIAVARPTQFGSVPRIFEKAYAAVRAEIAKLDPGMRAMAEKVYAAGVASGRARRRGEAVDDETKMLAGIFDQQLGARIRARFGGRCARMASGAAPIALEILELFDACGLTTFEVYGLTETTGVATANRPDDIVFGSVGQALPGTELRIADDGEILIRGPIVFLGYLHDEAATAECMKDGWLSTGDIGRLDARGFLTITDRKKNILVTAGGKNITPSNVEGEVKRDPLVSYCHLHADRRAYPVALVCLDPERVRAFATENGLPATTAEELHGDERLRARVKEAIDRANERLARYEQLRKFAILPRELSVDAGELTPTLKVKRREVDRKYADVLDALYQGEPGDQGQ
jgi:long-chain acyl-CoA synthetase